ncbi:MAG: GMC family oxidoreductase [Betaproteobacteria bacterium]|nr:GMC family oxidoreductase [Betaproteobacteria bacterium]
MADILTADVVIVGSGVAGAITGYSLARAGAKVLILEAGPRVDRAKAVVQFRNSPTKGPNSPYPANPKVPQPDPDDIGSYYVQAGPVTFNGLQARVVGGTTWHWGGLTLRYRPNDFRLKSKFGVGVDWPLSYDDLEPWYGEAEREIGVCGPPDYDWGSPRSTPYPMPPIAPTYLDTVIGAACAGVGLTMAPFPHGRNSVGRDGRPPCCGNASCVPICPIGAKYDASVHVAKAEAAGARVVPLAIAHEIVVGADRKVTAIRFKRPDGSVHEARGKVFVVAAHAIETPKLLLMSRVPGSGLAVANSSDQVGRNLMTQLDAGMIGLTREKLWPYRGPVETSGIRELRDGDFRGMHGASGTSPSNEGWVRALGPMKLAQRFAAQGLTGGALAAAISDHMARELAIGPSVEVLPNPNNRVTLAQGRPDPLGLPRPRIWFNWGTYEQEGMKVAMEYVLGLMNALGATDVQRLGPVTDGAVMGGTCRMGDDARTSVVDRNLRAHDHPNLYVVGSATFPTITASPPTLTIAAFALRAGLAIRRDLGGA